MKRKCISRYLCILVCVVLMAAMALASVGCTPRTDGEAAPIIYSDGSDVGQGERSFALTVADRDGKENHFTVHTDCDTVGEALVEAQFISGEQGDYGLYIKTVNGISADYDTDGVYWAFYINGEYAMTGVDATQIDSDAVYALRIAS